MTASRRSPTAPEDHLTGLQRALVGLEAALAVGAWGGAIGLMSGAMSLAEYDSRLPFASKQLGGAALAVVVAVPATVACILTLRRHRLADPAHLAVGALLMVWIVVQIGFIGFVAGLQPIMFVWGALIEVLAVLRWRQREHGPG